MARAPKIRRALLVENRVMLPHLCTQLAGLPWPLSPLNKALQAGSVSLEPGGSQACGSCCSSWGWGPALQEHQGQGLGGPWRGWPGKEPGEQKCPEAGPRHVRKGFGWQTCR